MEIADIKSRLTLSMLMRHYGLKADKQARLCCPFHPDRTPSLQLYYKTQTCYCFSTNCPTHGRSMDVIDFIMHKESITKHAAILKAQTLLGVENGELKVENYKKEPESSPSTLRSPLSTDFLQWIFTYFRNGIYNSKPALDYLSSRALDVKQIEVGYNSGQFHHGERRSEELINNCLQAGLLLDKGAKSKTGEKAYSVFGNKSLVFPLRDKENHIVSLYFRSTINNDTQKHYYLKNRSGLYPGYPDPETNTLILTESIIDAASLPSLPFRGDLEGLFVLACYGTNGFTPQHQEAIKNLTCLEEIIFAFDNDEAGKKATGTYALKLHESHPNIQLSRLDLPCKDVNETLIAHSPEVFTHLLKERITINIIGKQPELFLSTENPTEKEITEPCTVHPSPCTPQTDAISFLKQPDLLSNLNRLIGQSGIVGEETSRLLLFLITISYLNKQPLHALVQGSSGSGKTHIINRLADMMPPQDVLRFTRITESSLYNWGEFDLHQKIIVIEDLDGLKEDALYALREFISNQVLRSSVTIKDKKGNNRSHHKIVKGQFSSLSATTKGETYEDNMSRSFLLAVDESSEQTQKIISYQNRRNAGEIEPEASQKSIRFIREIVRSLKTLEVINPYATKLQLPEKVHKIRRLNEMYQSVIKQVTFLNQYQRKLTPNNQLLTEIQDIEQATEVLFESIVLKVDELDGSLRQFFEQLKKYIKSPDREFILRDVRQQMNVSKTQLFRYMQILTELEYVRPIGGYANKGLKYKISYWDNYQKLRSEIKEHLLRQIEQLKQGV